MREGYNLQRCYRCGAAGSGNQRFNQCVARRDGIRSGPLGEEVHRRRSGADECSPPPKGSADDDAGSGITMESRVRIVRILLPKLFRYGFGV